MTYIKSVQLGNVDTTRFKELKMSSRATQMSFKPTWGVSLLRYDVDTTGVGASVDEVDGEFQVQSGTDVNGKVHVQTKQRGEYQSRSEGETGMGIRIPSRPTGTQYFKWGFSDFDNSGFYTGEDSTGVFAAYLTGGVETKEYQADWSVDKLDGSGPSGLNLDFAEGNISHVDFIWYGYGDIRFIVFIYNPVTQILEEVVAHVFKIDEAASIIDPNQPIAFEIGNGASSTSNFIAYVGGHQFSLTDGSRVSQKRRTLEILTDYDLPSGSGWQPLMAIRKKPTFRGRPNSVNVTFNDVYLSSDGELEIKVTDLGNVDQSAWATPTDYLASETAIETQVTSSGALLTSSSEGYPIAYGFLPAAKNDTGVENKNIDTKAGTSDEFIVWVRRMPGDASGITIKHAHVSCTEDW